jgi:hypothetical protein
MGLRLEEGDIHGRMDPTSNAAIVDAGALECRP